MPLYYRVDKNKILVETFEYPKWNDTFNIPGYNVPSFSGSALLTDTFEYPNWNDTFNINSYSVPSFTGSALLAEDFETGTSW